MSDDWHRMSALALGAGIESGAIDPRALAASFLARIEAADRDRAIYLRLTADRARAEAEAAHERARRGLRLSPLDGVPISWKDLYDSAGDVTSHGTPVLAEAGQCRVVEKSEMFDTGMDETGDPMMLGEPAQRVGLNTLEGGAHALVRAVEAGGAQQCAACGRSANHGL